MLTRPGRQKTLLFHVHYRRMHGGHLKVWHYFRHTLGSPDWRPRVYLDPDCTLEPDNFWHAERAHFADAYEPRRADAVFVAGPKTWDLLARDRPLEDTRAGCPVVAFVQGLRHADPQHFRYPMLRHPAVRVCVSEEVAAAVRATGIARGPVFACPNGTDVTVAAEDAAVLDRAPRACEVLIVGLKNPALAHELVQTLRREDAAAVSVLTEPVPRAEFLAALADAETALFLPHPQEGFYLPALEAMALGTFVICPDVGGNRAFCRAGENCLRPDYTPGALLAAWRHGRTLALPERHRMLAAALATAREHSLAEEGRRFLSILDRVESLWRQADF